MCRGCWEVTWTAECGSSSGRQRVEAHMVGRGCELTWPDRMWEPTWMAEEGVPMEGSRWPVSEVGASSCPWLGSSGTGRYTVGTTATW